MRSLFFLTLGLALLHGSFVHADDWPQFRGPTGQGHGPDRLPVQWGPDQNVTWKQKIPGRGWSSPVIWDG
jgi:hypothetical protein